MPNIFDNIDQRLLPALQQTLKTATHADFCVGYFNLRGWRGLGSYIENWDGDEGACCRLLVGMQRPPEEELRRAKRLDKQEGGMDNKTAHRLKQELAMKFREQLTIGPPTGEDEQTLQQLAQQIRDKKVKVKLFLQYPLHAKLYLLHRPDTVTPIVGYLGSSNLTLAGLSQQGELNIDVPDPDACRKLEEWFEERWNEHLCIDISDELVKIIEESWARETLIPPHHIYIKMAYHLSQEAREGLMEFQIPSEFQGKLFEFQTAAVKIAAHHLNRRGGVLIGDVVGLGKTLMGTALARIQEDDRGWETLIICPKESCQYVAKIMHTGVPICMRRCFHLAKFSMSWRAYNAIDWCIIDESHNLRNREGKRYRAIQEYIEKNESQVILLTATRLTTKPTLIFLINSDFL